MHVDVVVVGAGMAGLIAARVLERAGLRVVVLEARDRVGGRAFTAVGPGGVTVDLGAQWVSPRQRRVHALVAELGLTLVPTHSRGHNILDLAGRRRMGTGDLPPLPWSAALDVYRFMSLAGRCARSLPAAAPWEHASAMSLDGLSVSDAVERCLWTRTGRAYARAFLEGELCLPVEEVSWLNLLWAIAAAGSPTALMEADAEWLLEGAQTLATRLAATLAVPVELNTPVQRIEYDGAGVLVAAGERRWSVRRVIVAIPPVLTTEIEFQPPLPAARQAAAAQATPGSVLKAVVVYETPFWRTTGANGRAFSDHPLGLSTFDSSPPAGPHGVLTVLVGGRAARVLQGLSPEVRRDRLLASLTQVFGPSAAMPTDYFEKSWSEDPWARGGYTSHFAPGALTSCGAALLTSVERIHWAGTETASEWRNFLEGALQSGERAAAEVLSSG